MTTTETTNRKDKKMTIADKINELKQDLEAGGSEQYKAEILRQIARLEHYLFNGRWPQ